LVIYQESLHDARSTKCKIHILCTQSHKVKVFVQCASSLGAMHFEKASVQTFFKLVLVCICSRTYIRRLAPSRMAPKL